MAEAPPPPRQGLISGVIVTLIAEGIALPAGLITAMVMTRGLGPETYGRFTVVATTLAITEWLLIAVLARAVVKFVAEAEDWKPVAATSFRIYVVGGLGIGLAFWALAGTVAALLGDPVLADYFRLFAIQIPVFATGAASRNVLAGQGRYRQQAIASAVGWIGRVTFIVLFIELGFGIVGAILGSICGTLSGSLTAVVLVGPAIWGPARFPVRQLMQLALPAFLAMLFARLVDQMGLLAVQVLSTGEADVGYYGAAMNVFLLTGVIGAAVTPVLVSTVTAAGYRRDHDQVSQVSRDTVRFGLVLLPLAAVAAGAADELAVLLFGADFAEAAGPMAALIIAAVARAITVMVSAVLIAVDRAWTAALIALPLPFISVAALIPVIPAYGAFGAAVVTMVVALLATIVSVWVLAVVVGTRPPMATVLRSILLGAAAFLAAGAWPVAGWLVLSKVALLSLAVLGVFVASGELTRTELQLLLKAFSVRTGPPRGRPPAGPR
jgi:O-antigen/teichoic acid export membrane protein